MFMFIGAIGVPVVAFLVLEQFGVQSMPKVIFLVFVIIGGLAGHAADDWIEKNIES